MDLRRRALLATITGSIVAYSGCLTSDLPLFQVEVYNTTDERVVADVDVVHQSSGDAVVSKTVRLSPAGSDSESRRTVAQEFEKGQQYEATVTCDGRSEGELFRADESGARKLTFEIEDDAILSHFSGP